MWAPSSRAALVIITVVLVATGCQTEGTGEPTAAACTDLGGTLGSDDFCEVHETTANYTLSYRFPIGFADQSAVSDELKRRRVDFIDWVNSQSSPTTHPYLLDVTGKAYHSGNRRQGTQSLVLSIGNDTGVHPVTTFKAFNYNLTNHVPFGFDDLFKPGSDPVPMLNPIAQQAIMQHDPTAFAAVKSLTTSSYQQFAVTDDAIIFFFNQDGVMPHEDGPLEVTVPRSALADILA